MKKVLFLIYFFIVSLALADDSKPFAYNDNGKKDPLGPLVDSNGGLINNELEFTASDIILEGIIADAKGNNLAILNGKVVKAGDKVSSYIVGVISVQQVELLKGQEQLFIKMKKGGV
jgi:hypothetical protein